MFIADHEIQGPSFYANSTARNSITFYPSSHLVQNCLARVAVGVLWQTTSL